MQHLRKLSLAVSVAIAAALPISAVATNGYFLEGYGAKSRGMGGVGIAYGQDGLAAGFNPAAMIQVDASRFDVGGEYFHPQVCVTHDSNTLGNTNECSTADTFLIPSMGGVFKVGDGFALGFAAIGAGLATNFDQTPRDQDGDGTPDSYFYNLVTGTGALATNEVGVSLIQMQMLPSVAFSFMEDQTLGFSIAMAAQVFRAYGLGSFVTLGFSTSSEALTNRGPDWSYGLGWRVGYLGRFFDQKLAVGLNYAAEVNMSEFNRYSGLFAEGGNFDIPENYGIGITLSAIPRTNISFDIMKINYSGVASVGNPGPNPFDANDLNPLCPPPAPDTPDCKLGGGLGMGFGWRDQTVFKLGVDFKATENTTLRTGWNYGESPVPSDQVLFNLLAPGVTENHLMLGATYETKGKDFLTQFLGAKTAELTFNYVHAFRNTVEGPTMFFPGTGSAPNNGSTNASAGLVIDTLGFSYGAKW
jgi:long-chain fatty acid transport protein